MQVNGCNLETVGLVAGLEDVAAMDDGTPRPSGATPGGRVRRAIDNPGSATRLIRPANGR